MGFVATSIILVATSKKYVYWRYSGPLCWVYFQSPIVLWFILTRCLVSSTTVNTSCGSGCIGVKTDEHQMVIPPTIHSVSISISNPLTPFSINAWIHNSLCAGHWAHAINTWSCMSHRLGIFNAHMLQCKTIAKSLLWLHLGKSWPGFCHTH